MSAQAETRTEVFFTAEAMTDGEKMALDQAIDVHEILVHDFTRWREIFHYMTAHEQKITSNFLKELGELEHRPEEVFELRTGALCPPPRKLWEDCKRRYMAEIGDMGSDYLNSQKEGLEALTQVMYRLVMTRKQKYFSVSDIEENADMVPDHTAGPPNTLEEMPDVTSSVPDMEYRDDGLTGTSGNVSITESGPESPAASDTSVSDASGSYDRPVSRKRRPTRESARTDMREAAHIRHMRKLVFRRRSSSSSGNLESKTSVTTQQSLPISFTSGSREVPRSGSVCEPDANDERN